MTKILYVEDNEDNVYMLRRRLDRRGFKVIVANDGQEAIDLTLREQPDIIVMDLSLPVLDGWQATQRLKAAPMTKKIPILALSAHARDEDRDEALAAGCDDFDTKPVDFPRLLEKIDRLLGN